MKDTNKAAQTRLVLGAILLVASPFIAFWAAQLFTPTFCSELPSDDPMKPKWDLFPCVDIGFYIAATAFAVSATISVVLASWRVRKRKQ